MHRQVMTFEEFDRVFMSTFGGYLPVYASNHENDAGTLTNAVDLDLICEWRLADGKVKFVTVTFTDREQFDRIAVYLINAVEALRAAILKNIDDLIESRSK